MRKLTSRRSTFSGRSKRWYRVSESVVIDSANPSEESALKRTVGINRARNLFGFTAAVKPMSLSGD